MEDKDRLELLMSAQVRPVEDESEVDQIVELLAASHLDASALETLQARPAPIQNGRPRMLHVDGFIVHEGRNENGDHFFAEELKEIVDNRKLFADGFAAVIDFNHDFVPRGYWYSAEFSFDPVANLYGILAHGAVWSWLYPDFADQMLAEQVRHGDVKLSQALLVPRSQTELSIDGDGHAVRYVHYPVFVAASLLDKRPADPFGRGQVGEDPSDGAASVRRDELMVATSLDGEPQEEINMEELKSILTEALAGLGLEARLDDLVTQMQAALEAQTESVREELAQRDETLVAANARIAEAEATVQTLTAELAERDVRIEALASTQGALEARIAEFEAAAAEAARNAEAEQYEARKAARLAALPEEVSERLNAKPEDIRNSIVELWASLSDEEWQLKLEELMLTAGTPQVRRFPGISSTADNGRVDLSQFIQTRS